MNPVDIAREAIELFLEYRDKYGYRELDAKDKALGNFVDLN